MKENKKHLKDMMNTRGYGKSRSPGPINRGPEPCTYYEQSKEWKEEYIEHERKFEREREVSFSWVYAKGCEWVYQFHSFLYS